MSEKDSIIGKIRKLFALGTSDNINEAALAISKAQALMTQYNIAKDDLVKNDIKDIIEVDIELAKRFNGPQLTFAVKICEAFFCRPLLLKTKTGYHEVEKKIRFIGEESDVAIATYVYSYMLSLAESKSKDYYEEIRYRKTKWSPTEAKKVKTDFVLGFLSAVSKKLEAIKAEREAANRYEAEMSQALVVAKNALIDRYMEKNTPDLGEHNVKNSYNPRHFAQGYVEGEKHGIYRGISGSDNATPTLIGG